MSSKSRLQTDVVNLSVMPLSPVSKMAKSDAKNSNAKSIKEVKRDTSKNFNFEPIGNETNLATIARVLAFCRDNPDAVENLKDGSVYHGSKLDG